jgi:hypothetical protein
MLNRLRTTTARATGRNRVARPVSIAVAGVLLVALSACGTPPWEGASTAKPSKGPSSTSTAKVTSVPNELASGNAVHTLTAGAVSLTSTYWSTLPMNEWTASANKPLSFSLIGTIAPDDGQNVYLSRVTLTTEVNGPKGRLDPPAPFTDQSTVNPGYLIKSPYSYSETFILPEVDSAATSVTLSITYELLIQAAPLSGEYAKQTAVDTLTVAIAPKAE